MDHQAESLHRSPGINLAHQAVHTQTSSLLFRLGRRNRRGRNTFRLYGAEFTHQGEDCTFETMMNRFGFCDDAALQEIAEIVHDLDLKDNKFSRFEAPGLSAVIKGLAELLKDDRKLILQCDPIFDGLYESFNRENEQRAKKEPRERKFRNRVRSRKKANK